MHESKIAEYRAQAETCLGNAERTHDIPTQRYWLQLADTWTRLADSLANPDRGKTTTS
jgi:hypothetical protein